MKIPCAGDHCRKEATTFIVVPTPFSNEAGYRVQAIVKPACSDCRAKFYRCPDGEFANLLLSVLPWHPKLQDAFIKYYDVPYDMDVHYRLVKKG